MGSDTDLNDRIVDVAVDLAARDGWDNVHLRDVAAAVGIGLDDLAARFHDRDAIANAWFARARAAMLAPVDAGFFTRPARERLYILLTRWLDTLAPRRQVSVEMLKVKLWPFHPHHWVPLVFDLSRTVLWWRDAAGLTAPPPRREVEEVGLTWLFLATLVVWATDPTVGQRRTRRFLAARLADADCVMAGLPLPPARRKDRPRATSRADPDLIESLCDPI